MIINYIYFYIKNQGPVPEVNNNNNNNNIKLFK